MLLILARGVHFGTCLVLRAIFPVRLFVERPAGDGGRAGRPMAALCLGVAAASGFLWFWVATSGMSGSGLLDSLSPQLFGLVLVETPWGHAWLVRCAIMAVLGAVLCFWRGRWSWTAGALLSAALVGSVAWLGHAGATGDGRRPWMLAVDVAHLLAVSVWPAGLLPFALLLSRCMKAGALPAAYAAARRFSAMSLIAVSVLTASGVANSFFLVGSFHALVSSDYGRVLIFKVVLAVTAVAFGAWNLLVHEPLLASDPAALRAMGRKVWIEVALGALIVLVTAVLGMLPPAWYTVNLSY